MTDRAKTPPPRRKSGTETRQLKGRLNVRCTEAQRQTIAQAADAAGLSLSAYVLAVALNKSLDRNAAVSKIDRGMLAQLLGKLGKIGSNINQIAHQLNAGRNAGAAEINAIKPVMLALRNDIMKALGKRPGEEAGP